MENIQKKIKSKFSVFFIFLLPISFCLGQAAVAIYFSLVSIFFFYELRNFTKININSNKLLLILLLLFFLFLIISSLFSEYSLDATKNSIMYIRFLCFFLISFIFVNLSFDKFHIIQLRYFIFLFLIILFVVADAYYQYFDNNKLDIFGFKPKPEHFPRLTGIFKDEPIVGSFLFHIGFTSIIFVITYIDQSKLENLLKLIFTNAIIITYLFIIIVSGERTSFIMVLFSFFLISPFILVNKKNLLASIIFFLAISFFLVTNNTYVKQRYSIFLNEINLQNLNFKKIFKNKESDFVNKKINRSFFDSQWGAHYLTSIEMIKEKPLFGVGIRGFRKECSNEKYLKINSLSKDVRCSSHPHNIYLEIFSETGFVSFFLFVSFLIFFFIKCVKIIIISNKKKIKYIFEYNIFLSLIAICIAVFFPIKATGSFFSNFYGSLIWYNLTFLFVYLLYFQNIFFKKNKLKSISRG